MLIFTRSTSPATALFRLCVSACLLILILSFFYPRASRADDPSPYRLQLVVEGSVAPDTYSYRKENDSRTIGLMLYGFQNQPVTAAPSILKDRKALSGFFQQHLAAVKRDYLGQDGNQTFSILTGDRSFTSTSLNRGLEQDPAKMVGITLPVGGFTLGGGYTWGEKNPAILSRGSNEGLMAGVAYDTGKVGFQLSYLVTGRKVAGFDVGGGTQYDSLMFGTSWRVNDRMGVTATAQYRRDKDDLTTGDSQAVFTIGTMFKF